MHFVLFKIYTVMTAPYIKQYITLVVKIVVLHVKSPFLNLQEHMEHMWVRFIINLFSESVSLVTFQGVIFLSVLLQSKFLRIQRRNSIKESIYISYVSVCLSVCPSVCPSLSRRNRWT